MTQEKRNELQSGFETAYIDATHASNLAYKQQFVSNNYKSGKKVLSSIEDELLVCERFQISVAFITMSGITPLLQTLKELERKNIPGEILTMNYLNFSECIIRNTRRREQWSYSINIEPVIRTTAMAGQTPCGRCYGASGDMISGR